METLLLWVYRTLSYFLPGGIMLWTFVIENMLSEEVSWTSKLGASGIFILVVMIILCIFFVNKEFTKREQKYEKLSIKEIDLQKREEYIKKWKVVEKNHEIFKNILMLAVLLTLTLLISLLETKLLSLRGTMITICTSFAGGTGINVIYKNMKLAKENK